MKKRERLALLDLIRGLVLIEMILYHLLWDLVYLFDIHIGWYKSYRAYIWQQSICWIFILLSGFCWQLGKEHIKRGAWIFGCGCIVSIVTRLVMPENCVRYGILTLLGSCILIWTVLEKQLKKVNPILGMGVCFSLFLLCKSWTNGTPIRLSATFMKYECIKQIFAYIGFPQAGFTSSDYFPILPWIFLFGTGYFLYSFMLNRNMLHVTWMRKGKIKPINFFGRHSLFIYMIHQPICYVIGILVSILYEITI